jgi:hypothetical protein
MTRRLTIWHLIPLVIASFLAMAAVCLGSVREPRGYYVLQGIDKANVSDSAIRAADGFSIRVSWAAIDKQTRLDWSWLDSQIARAKKAGKPYMLRFMAGTKSPKWIGGTWYQGAPLPWNTTAQAKLSQFVMLAGARYASDPNLMCVHLSSTANHESAEMHLAPGLTNRSDYTLAKLTTAWTNAVEDYGRAFPGVSLALNASIEPDSRGALTTAVIAHCQSSLGERATFQHNSLKASTSESAAHHELIAALSATNRTGFQMACPSSNGDRFGGTFAQAIAKGDRAGADYYEVYQGDVP